LDGGVSATGIKKTSRESPKEKTKFLWDFFIYKKNAALRQKKGDFCGFAARKKRKKLNSSVGVGRLGAAGG
jgi:hypothetical protein